MIRDPSDGSVREALRVAEELGRLVVDQGRERMGLNPLPQASGLPLESTKPENIARLEKSREWLKDYRKEQANARAVVMTRNIRRQGIRAPKEPMSEFGSSGPTKQRLAAAQGHVSIGDDQQGTRIYHFHDSPLDRLYSRLTKRAGRYDEEQLRKEYVALQKYKHHWNSAGLESSLGSADLNRIFASDPGSMSGMAKSERQAHHRQQYRAARDGKEGLGHKPGIVVDNVVCAETSLEVAGWSIGYNSRTSARDNAERILRESGQKLAKLWGIG